MTPRRYHVNANRPRRRGHPRLPLASKGDYAQRWSFTRSGYWVRKWRRTTPFKVEMGDAPKGDWGVGKPFTTETVYRDKTSGLLVDKAKLKAYIKRKPSYRKAVRAEKVYRSKITGKQVSAEVATHVVKRWVKKVKGKWVSTTDKASTRKGKPKSYRRVSVRRARHWTDMAWLEAHKHVSPKRIQRLKKTFHEFRRIGASPRKSPDLKRYVEWLQKYRPLMYLRLRKEGYLPPGHGEVHMGWEELLRKYGLSE